MIYSNPYDITFYVENQTNRPQTASQNIKSNLPLKKRRYTPLVKSRNIVQKFLIQFKSQQIPQILTQRKNKPQNLNERYSKRRKSKQEIFTLAESQRHLQILQRQKQNYLKVMRKYCDKAQSHIKEINSYIELYP